MHSNIRNVARVLVASLVAFCSAATFATPIISGPYHYRDQRTANSVGFFPGDRLTFGLTNVSPSGPGTTVTGANPAFIGTPDLFFVPTSAAPNNYTNSVPFDPAIAANAWTLSASDGIGAPAVATTPVPSAAPVTPFITSFSLSNPGATPTFNWTVPTGSTHTSQSIFIFDLEDTLASTGNPPIIFTAGQSFDDLSFAVDPGILEPNHHYSVAVQLDDFLGRSLLSRSRSFFDFVTSASIGLGIGSQAFLPSVDPTGSPSGGPVYHFNVGEVIAGEQIFIDPFVAIGYEYQKGANDENFASVVLPNIGDGIFSLSFFDGTSDVIETLLAETVFAFPVGGVAAFTIGGIEASAGLDPADVTAFVTGLTFVANSTFTGTMTPITIFVQSVSEPGTIALITLGFIVTGFARKRRIH